MNPDGTDVNRFAVEVLHRIAKNPGEDFNPLFILGNNNGAKRSYLQEVGNEIKMRHRELRIFYESLDYLMQRDDLILRAYDPDVMLLDALSPEAFRSGFVEKEIKLLNRFLLEDKQLVCLIDFPISLARERLSLFFPLPEKSLLLDITPESDEGRML